MPAPLSGPGIGLPLPQNLYPTALQNAPIDQSSNRVALAPGQELPLAAGNWWVSLGQYLVAEFLDPVNNIWTIACAAGWQGGLVYLKSDGFNWRIANRLGCPVSATVIQYGTNYVQGTTTVTQVSAGIVGAVGTWVPIVGGQLVFSGASVTTAAAGAGYGIAPLVLIPPPPGPAQNSNGVGGIQAVAHATIANGTVSTITFDNQGAGYNSGFTIALLANPTDPNLATGITLATAYFSLSSLNTNGGITGVLCTNPGGPLNNGSLGSITLSIGGAGTGASVVANILQTVVTMSVTGAGSGTVSAPVVAFGGAPPTNAASARSPEALGLAFRPRQPNISVIPASTGVTGTIYDGGLFLGAPTAAALSMPGATPTIATVSPTMGSVPDIAIIQPAP